MGDAAEDLRTGQAESGHSRSDVNLTNGTGEFDSEKPKLEPGLHEYAPDRVQQIIRADRLR